VRLGGALSWAKAGGSGALTAAFDHAQVVYWERGFTLLSVILFDGEIDPIELI
jgi:hypothetical protein